MIPYSKQSISEEDIREVVGILHSDFLTQGPCVPEFEEAIKERFSVKHAVVCSSGTAALHLAYAGAGAGKDTVGIVPSITFSATANAFLYLGAQARFCDVDPATGLICCDSLEAVVRAIQSESQTESIFVSPVSFAGATAPLDRINLIAQKYGLKVIEDASHSPGSFTESENCLLQSASCVFSDAACLSFHPVKHICCGEGGAVLTNDDHIAESARKLRSHGIVRPNDSSHDIPWFYEQNELGWNYRLTDIQAGLGRSQLSRLDSQLSKRRSIASKYDLAFNKSPFQDIFDCPPMYAGHAWHLYIVRFKVQGHRDQAHKFLKSKGVNTQVHYVPVHKHPFYADKTGPVSLPGAEKFYESCLSIPMFPTLTENEQQKVIEGLMAFCEETR
jgi:dTDP-4-amino-4,6-dideoxygalactose transaminase